MTVRRADHYDHWDVVEMARSFHTETGYPVAFDIARVRNLVRGLTGTSSGVILVAGEPLCGFLAASKGISAMTGEMYAEEVAFWVHPDHRRGAVGGQLIDKYVQWAKSSNCDVARMTSQTNMRPELVARVYRKHGFHHHETAFLRRL